MTRDQMLDVKRRLMQARDIVEGVEVDCDAWDETPLADHVCKVRHALDELRDAIKVPAP